MIRPRPSALIAEGTASMLKTIRIASGVLVVALTVTTGSVAAGYAASPPLSGPALIAHFDLGQGQLPENIVDEPGGSVVVTFAASRQLARVDTTGRTRVLATLPAPTEEEGAHTPVLHFPLATGLVRSGSGVLYALYAAGSASLTGQGDTVLAALNQPNTVALVAPGRAARTVLTAADGLQGPTAVAVHGNRVWVASAAYNTQTDPNLLTARLDLR
ncbi:hypothetical protein ACPPVO_21035 [Dactylosporangium sp. McL0621]|uniref:hypothetical protein n=1 Tax=Dactylosporangium sp. McL0621 TaxID=3415678 RepID=UPI003CFADA06